MKFKGTLFLLIAAAIVACFYFFFVLPHGREMRLREELSRKFFRADTNQVEFMRIINDKGAFDLVRDDNRAWRLKSPRSLPADQKTIDGILEAIRGGRIQKIISTDLSRRSEYGLNTPQTVIALGYGGAIDELALGGVNPAGSGQYAFAQGVNAIFLVDPKISRAVTVGLYELRSKTLFAFDPDAVTDISIASKSQTLRFQKKGEVWEIIQPVRKQASNTAVQAYLAGFTAQRADEVFDENTPAAGPADDALSISLKSADGDAPVVIDLIRKGVKGGQGIIGHQRGLPQSGRLSREFWDFARRNAESFIVKNVFQFDEENLRSIEVTKGKDRYVLQKEGGEWLLAGRRSNHSAVMNFLWFLKAWNADIILAMEDTGMKQDALSLEILLKGEHGSNMGALKVYGKMEGRSPGHTADGLVEQFYAVSLALREPFLVNSLDLRKVPGKEAFAQ